MESIEYFKKNFSSVPVHVPILVVANFRDLSEEWVISESELESLVNHCALNEEPGKKAEEAEAAAMSPMSPKMEDGSEKTGIDSRSFRTLVDEVYHERRRVIKLVQTSLLERFGLQVLLEIWLDIVYLSLPDDSVFHLADFAVGDPANCMK